MGARLASTQESQPPCRRPRAPPPPVQLAVAASRRGAAGREARYGSRAVPSPCSARLGSPRPSPTSLRGPWGRARGEGGGGGRGWPEGLRGAGEPTWFAGVGRGGSAGRELPNPQCGVNPGKWGAREPRGGVGDRAGTQLPALGGACRLQMQPRRGLWLRPRRGLGITGRVRVASFAAQWPGKHAVADRRTGLRWGQTAGLGTGCFTNSLSANHRAHGFKRKNKAPPDASNEGCEHGPLLSHWPRRLHGRPRHVPVCGGQLAEV